MKGALAIGIDLGGSQVRVALVQTDGTVLRKEVEPTDVSGGPTVVLKQFARLIDRISASETSGEVSCVGIAAPGPLDSETGTILHIPTLPGWEEFPLRDVLARQLGLPVLLEGDAIAAAYGEWQFGAGRGLRNLVYVTVSTGIGGGAVVDGRLLRGRRGMAGHIGHIRLAQNGPRCSCGAAGCFEALAAGTALARRARQVIAETPSALPCISGAEIDARRVVEAARAGDSGALELIKHEAQYLGIGFTAVIHAYSPERVIMGGGVSQAFDLLEEGIHNVIQRNALPPFRDVRVVAAGLAENSGVIGAASLALRQEMAF
jgi:glucokinase